MISHLTTFVGVNVLLMTLLGIRYGNFTTISDMRIVAHRITTGFIHHRKFLSDLDDFIRVRITARTHIATPMRMRKLPVAGVRKNTIPRIFSLANAPSTIKNNHVAPTRLHRNATIKSPKIKTSWKAVGFAITAAEKNIHDKIAYIVVSLSCVAL